MDELPYQPQANQNEELLNTNQIISNPSAISPLTNTSNNNQILPPLSSQLQENPQEEPEDDKNSDNDPTETETNTQAINEMLAQLQTEQEDPSKSQSNQISPSPVPVKQDPLSEQPVKKDTKKLLTSFNPSSSFDEIEGNTIIYSPNKDIQYMSVNLISSKLLNNTNGSPNYGNISKQQFLSNFAYQKPCLLTDDTFYDMLSYTFDNVDKKTAIMLLNQYIMTHFQGELQNKELIEKACTFYKKLPLDEIIHFYDHSLTIRELISTLQDKDTTRSYVKFMEWSGQKLYKTNDKDKTPVELPLEKYTTCFEISKWSSREIAKQLTLITFHLFRNIDAKEVLNCVWTKADKSTTSPNITKLINRFNQISCWMSDEILSYDHASQRGKIIAKFIEIADELQQMNNYNDCFNIVTGFNYLPIKRLTKSWNRVGETALETLKKLSNLCSLTRNWGNLRDEYKRYKEMDDSSKQTGCIPYLGYFLKELAFIDEGPKYFNENDLICVEKVMKVGKVIEELKYFQRIAYGYQPAFGLAFLAEPKPQDEDKLLALSKKLEPKFILLKSKTMKKRPTETDTKYAYLNMEGSGNAGIAKGQGVFNAMFKGFLKENGEVNAKVMTLRERLQLMN